MSAYCTGVLLLSALFWLGGLWLLRRSQRLLERAQETNRQTLGGAS